MHTSHLSYYYFPIPNTPVYFSKITSTMQKCNNFHKTSLIGSLALLTDFRLKFLKHRNISAQFSPLGDRDKHYVLRGPNPTGIGLIIRKLMNGQN